MLAMLEAQDFGTEGLQVFAMNHEFFGSNHRGQSEEAKSERGQDGAKLETQTSPDRLFWTSYKESVIQMWAF